MLTEQDFSLIVKFHMVVYDQANSMNVHYCNSYRHSASYAYPAMSISDNFCNLSRQERDVTALLFILIKECVTAPIFQVLVLVKRTYEIFAIILIIVSKTFTIGHE